MDRSAVRPDELVRGLYRAFELRDLARVATMLAPDVAWLDAEPSRDLHGTGEALDWLEGLVVASRGAIAVRLQRVYAHTDGRVVTFHELASRTDTVRTGCLLWDVAGEQVRRVTPLRPVPSGRPG